MLPTKNNNTSNPQYQIYLCCSLSVLSGPLSQTDPRRAHTLRRPPTAPVPRTVRLPHADVQRAPPDGHIVHRAGADRERPRPERDRAHAVPLRHRGARGRARQRHVRRARARAAALLRPAGYAVLRTLSVCPYCGLQGTHYAPCLSVPTAACRVRTHPLCPYCGLQGTQYAHCLSVPTRPAGYALRTLPCPYCGLQCTPLPVCPSYVCIVSLMSKLHN